LAEKTIVENAWVYYIFGFNYGRHLGEKYEKGKK
jgi:hypothetical protein